MGDSSLSGSSICWVAKVVPEGSGAAQPTRSSAMLALSCLLHCCIEASTLTRPTFWYFSAWHSGMVASFWVRRHEQTFLQSLQLWILHLLKRRFQILKRYCQRDRLE